MRGEECGLPTRLVTSTETCDEVSKIRRMVVIDGIMVNTAIDMKQFDGVDSNNDGELRLCGFSELSCA